MKQIDKTQNISLKIVGRKTYKDLHSKLIRNEEFREEKTSKTFFISNRHIISFINKAVNDYFVALTKEDEPNTSSMKKALDQLSIENFFNFLTEIESPVKKERSYSMSRNYDPENSLDKYIFEDDLDSLNYFLKDAYKKFNSCVEDMLNYQYNRIDTGYYYSQQNGSEYFAVIGSTFKENVVDKITSFEVFKELVMKKIDAFKESKLKEIPLFEFDEDNGKVYTVPKEIDVESIIKTSEFPEITVHHLYGVKLIGLDSYKYYFSEYSPKRRLEMIDRHYNNYNDLRISVYPNAHYMKAHNQEFEMQTLGFNYEKEVVLFTNLLDAENYYKSKLLEVRNKIDKLLTSSVVF